MGIPLCCVHEGLGLSYAYRVLGDYLDCPIIGINQIPDNGEFGRQSIRDMAKDYADRLQALYPVGPYNLLGWSFGGPVAHELAVELRRRGCEVQRLIMLDPVLGDSGPTNTVGPEEIQGESRILDLTLRSNRIAVPEHAEPLTYERAEELIRQQGKAVELILPPRQIFEFVVDNYNSNGSHLRQHVPGVFDGEVIIFSARRDVGNESSDPRNWNPYVEGAITVYPVDCGHDDMMAGESLALYGDQLKLALES
jgi:thioesterase domain-containing protein